MIRNVILDWSGTLVDDLPAVWAATNHVLDQVGRPRLTLEEFRDTFVLPVAGFYDRVLPGQDRARLEASFFEEFVRLQERVTPLPHARAFLEYCQRSQCRVYILTSVPEVHYRAQVERFGWSGMITAAWTSVRDKCAAIGGLLARHGVVPADSLLVGDMQHDLDAARSVGMPCCAVLTGYQRLEQLRSANPDWIVEHLAELQGRMRNQFVLPGPGSQTPPRRPVATVGALVFNDRGEVLLVRTRKWSDLWGIPGGKIEYGESSEEALRRELREETGLDVEDIRLVLVQDCVEPEEFHRKEHFLLLNYTAVCRGAAEVRLNHEAYAYVWVPLDQALAKPLNRPTRVLLEHVAHNANRA